MAKDKKKLREKLLANTTFSPSSSVFVKKSEEGKLRSKEPFISSDKSGVFVRLFAKTEISGPFSDIISEYEKNEFEGFFGEYLGGKKNLNIKESPETEEDYIKLVRKGIAKKSIDHLIETTDILFSDMANILETTPRKLAAIKPDTLMEKSQSEKAVSIARLYGLGQEVFGSKDEFNKWMNGRVPSLGKKKPKEYLDTISGINLLMDELGRIQHGVYS